MPRTRAFTVRIFAASSCEDISPRSITSLPTTIPMMTSGKSRASSTTLLDLLTIGDAGRRRIGEPDALKHLQAARRAPNSGMRSRPLAVE